MIGCSQVAIKEGEEISTQYVHSMNATYARRYKHVRCKTFHLTTFSKGQFYGQSGSLIAGSLIKKSYQKDSQDHLLFLSCPRCCDPFECGANLAALSCNRERNKR